MRIDPDKAAMLRSTMSSTTTEVEERDVELGPSRDATAVRSTSVMSVDVDDAPPDRMDTDSQ